MDEYETKRPETEPMRIAHDDATHVSADAMPPVEAGSDVPSIVLGVVRGAATASRPSGLIPGGRIGNKGGGRKPGWFVAKANRIIDEVVVAQVESIVRAGPIGNRDYWHAVEWLSRYAKSPAPIATVSAVSVEPLTVIVRSE